MYKEVLYPEQIENLWLLELFKKEFYLAWGTAIALQLWHRKSIDFDLFSPNIIRNSHILKILEKHNYSVERVLVDNKWEELTCIIWGTKVSFIHYPFKIDLSDTLNFENMKIPNLKTLWAMKLYTLWRRGKWKDYVDIFFLCQQIKLTEISDLAELIFGGWYNEKLMREQLCYFDDIDYTEEVEYLWKDISREEIQNWLKEWVLKN